MPASKAINTGDSSSIYWPWPLQKLSVCITMDFDEHTMERRRGGVGFKGWSTDCSGLDAEEEECNLCASISSGVVGSEGQFSMCTFVKVTHVPLLENWPGTMTLLIRALERFGGYGYECGAE